MAAKNTQSGIERYKAETQAAKDATRTADPTRTASPRAMTMLANLVADAMGLQRDKASGYVLNGTPDGTIPGLAWAVQCLQDGTATVTMPEPVAKDDPQAMMRAMVEAMPEPMRSMMLAQLDANKPAPKTRTRRAAK